MRKVKGSNTRAQKMDTADSDRRCCTTRPQAQLWVFTGGSQHLRWPFAQLGSWERDGQRDQAPGPGGKARNLPQFTGGSLAVSQEQAV